MFIYRYLLHPRRTGALCSSSAKLASIITQNIDIEHACNIAEIGAGTGAFTREILKKKSPNSRLIAIEIDNKMAEKLGQKFPNLDLELAPAQDLPRILQKRNMQGLDAIVSGIPWALLKAKAREELLHIIYENLEFGGHFATFAYVLPTLSARAFRKQLFGLFSEVRISKIVWANIPPAFVYYCKK